ncbi:MAG: glycosyltransferase family 4 protein [bacterium]
MKVAFYAPMKSPDHARPSGDRRIARLFIAALRRAGSAVELASELRAWEGRGDSHRQDEIETQGAQEAARLIETYRRLPRAERPRCWFTYHPYHKAPDWIGPAVSVALDIPHVLAEASLAQKQRDGAWRRGHASTLAAVQRADLIFNLNPTDRDGLRPFVRRDEVLREIKPFADLPATDAQPAKTNLRRDLAARFEIDADANVYWLLCVAMMRDDSKLDSYRILADATPKMNRRDWRLLIAGDGVAESRVVEMFRARAPRSSRVRFLGRLDPDALYPLMRASDLLVWPARNEAIGMAALEALGCGLPVLAGDDGGIGGIVTHDVTGRLIAQPDGARMAMEIERLLAAPETLARMSAASLRAYRQSHQLERAAEIIGAALTRVIGCAD